MSNDFRPPTALHGALEADDDAAAIRAIEAGEDVNARDKRWSRGEGLTPLHVAAARNNAAMISFLIDSGAEIDAESEKGVSPLWVACENRNFRAVKVLLEHGANPSIKNRSGETPHDHITRITGEFLAILNALEQNRCGEPSDAPQPRNEAF